MGNNLIHFRGKVGAQKIGGKNSAHLKACERKQYEILNPKMHTLMSLSRLGCQEIPKRSFSSRHIALHFCQCEEMVYVYLGSPYDSYFASTGL